MFYMDCLLYSSKRKTLVILSVLSFVIIFTFTSLVFSNPNLNILAIKNTVTKIKWLEANSQKKEFINSSVVINIDILSEKNNEFASPYFVIPKNYSKTGQQRIANFSRKLKIIGCYNCPTWFLSHSLNLHNRDFKVCPFSECSFQPEVNNRGTADVLLFFVGLIQNNKPLPNRLQSQIWVKAFWESPVHYNYPTPYEPWRNAFNWTFTYRTDSNIFAPSNRLTWRDRGELLTRAEYLTIAKKKTKTAAWFVSHCSTLGKREDYVRLMQKHMDVDIYGSCGPLKCEQSMVNICETKLTTTYKFYLSFENSLCKDYVTEKFFRVFQYRSHIIPVVRGRFDYNKYFPNGIFVNTANFSSPKDLALYLKALGDDHEKYAQMLEQKDKFTTVNFKNDWCDFCEKVHTDTRTSIIPDIREWSHNNTCHAPTDF